MLRKLTTYAILVSMILHCSCRLGFLDELYLKRNEIALALGLIDELPMTTCNSDYDFDMGLKIETKDNHNGIPMGFTQAREINLFFISEHQFTPYQDILRHSNFPITPQDLYRLSLSISIFHPPTVLA